MPTMQYISTRGSMDPASFSEILITGLAPDGGLTVPVEMPRLSHSTIESWRQLSYPELAARVIALYWPEIPEADLLQLTRKAYGEQFDDARVVPVTELWPGFGLVGLSEGPTLAFKDMAMQFLGEAIPYVLAQTGGKLNIIGATSGDTGSAAEYAFRGKDRTSVIMLSPRGRMSDFQRAQMYSLTDANVHNVVIDGVFDDCQNLMKELNADLPFKAQHSLGAVNSVNLGRVAAQSVYYFWAWLRITDALPDTERQQQHVSFTVPSGNFGNVLSGYYAKKLGVPIAKLVIATNENNVLHELVTTGYYRPRAAADTFITSSPSMDISKASNLERLIYEMLGSDPEALKAAFQELDDTGQIDLTAQLAQLSTQFKIFSATSTHADRVATIKEVYDRTGVVIDPHTADGVKCALPHLTADTPMYVMETAKPQKFSETVTEALGFAAPLSQQMQHMLQLPQYTTELPVDSEKLREFVAANAL